jgi:hypothetical protein
MKIFWLKLTFGVWCAFALGSCTHLIQSPINNPIEVKTGNEFLKGDKKGPGDTGKLGPATTGISVFPVGTLGDLLRTHMKLITGVGKDPEQNFQDAEKAYQASLQELRKRASEVIPLLSTAYGRTEESNYFRRWALVETMRELQSETAVEALAKIATSTIPSERFRTDPERSSVDEEIRIRVTAVGGLSLLAKTNTIAERVLVSLVNNPYLGIQRTAIRGYLAAVPIRNEQKKRSEKLKAMLPPDRYHLITLETTDIKSVPHPDMPDQFHIKKPRPPEGTPPKAQQQSGTNPNFD